MNFMKICKVQSIIGLFIKFNQGKSVLQTQLVDLSQTKQRKITKEIFKIFYKK